MADIFVRGYARALAENGNRKLLDNLEAAISPTLESNGLQLHLSPEDEEPARISNPLTTVYVAADQATVTASMSFTGSYGHHSVSAGAVTLQGAPVTDIQTVEDGKWALTSILPTSFSTVMSLTLPQSCGLETFANTRHNAWFATVPVPLPLWEIADWMKWGEVQATSQNVIPQSPCGGGGGGGGGMRMGVYACYYTDHYDSNWGFLYTSFDGCELLYTYWNEQ